MKLYPLILAASVIILTSCKNDEKQQVIAEYGSNKLYVSDVYIPNGLKGNDSIVFLKNAVEQWITEQIFYEEAQKNLSDEEMNVDREIEKLKREIINARYEEKILKDSTISSISEAEIIQYYNDNPEEFLLKDNIVKVQYIKIAKGHKEIPTLRNLLQSTSSENNKKINELSESIAENAFLNDKAWLYFNDILKEIPIKTNDQEDYLKNNKYVEITQDSTTYLLSIKDYKIKDSRSPFILVKDKISAILLAKNKKEKLNSYRNKIRKNALSDNKIKTYL